MSATTEQTHFAAKMFIDGVQTRFVEYGNGVAVRIVEYVV